MNERKPRYEYQGTWGGQVKYGRFFVETIVKTLKELSDVGVVERFHSWYEQDKQEFLKKGPGDFCRVSRKVRRESVLSNVIANLGSR
jgi:hypothetical protein